MHREGNLAFVQGRSSGVCWLSRACRSPTRARAADMEGAGKLWSFFPKVAERDFVFCKNGYLKFVIMVWYKSALSVATKDSVQNGN